MRTRVKMVLLRPTQHLEIKRNNFVFMNKKSPEVKSRAQVEKRENLLAFFLMMSTQPGLVSRIERDGALDVYRRNKDGALIPKVERKITHTNLFDVTSKSLALHQLLANTTSPFLDKEMQEIWRMFVNQDSGGEMDFCQLAPEISHWEYRRSVAPISRFEFSFRAGTPVAYVGGETGFFIQDLLTVPGNRDPFRVIPSGISTLVREYSPLVALPKVVHEKDWELIANLGEHFVDTVAVLAEPVIVRMRGDDGGYREAFDMTHSLSLAEHLKRLQDGGCGSSQKFFVDTPGRATYWPSAGSAEVEISFMGKMVFQRGGYRMNPASGGKGFYLEGVTNAGYIRDALLLTVENEFLRSMNRTKNAAEMASIAFVEDLVKRNPEMLNMVSVDTLVSFSNLIYGTWVTGLMSLWRSEASNKVANYIQGR